MTTITLKLSKVLEAQLKIFAQKHGVSRSEIVRRALEEYFSHDDTNNSGSFLDLSRDLVGSVDGPNDLSTNNAYFERYGK